MFLTVRLVVSHITILVKLTAQLEVERKFFKSFVCKTIAVDSGKESF